MKLHLLPPLLALSIASTALSQEPSLTVKVEAPRVAVEESPATYSSIASQLSYEPQVDLQARNFGDAQGDVSIRGGIFEDSGVKVGATSIYDPQTGHYTVELPLDPHMLSPVKVLTGSEQALLGFNSTAGTLAYELRRIEDRGVLRAGVGDYRLNFQEAYGAFRRALGSENSLGLDLSAARSEGNGTRPEGDHQFERFSARMQLLTTDSQTDVAIGYQEKTFAWPYLYAVKELHDAVGSSGIEQDNVATTLVMVNHRMRTGTQGHLQLSGYFRDLRDDYEFDKFQPGLFNPFRHRTRVSALGADGREQFDDGWALTYGSQVMFDEVESSALVFGEFDSRAYGKAVIAPEYTVPLGEGRKVVLFGGAAFDDTDRDASEWSPVGGAALHLDALVHRVYAEYSEATRVPGYTALKSNPNGGLFRGNAALERQRTRNVESGIDFATSEVEGNLAVFGRADRDLTDWTYTSGQSPSAARTAQNVDIDTFGVEGFLEWKTDALTFFSGYGYLLKDDSYDSAEIDASFYALNYARHRVTFGAIWQLAEQFELRMDNEYRTQEPNALRSGARHPLLSTVSARWAPTWAQGFDVALAVDNVWDENFEEVPGVPGQRRLFSGVVGYRW